MENKEFKELKQRSLFSKLRRLFSNDGIVRNIGGKKLKVVDTDELAYATDRNTLQDRFNRIQKGGYNNYSKDFTLAYHAARIELFRDYDCIGADTVIPLPDGSRPTIAELAEKYKDRPQERFHVFSYDHKTDSIKLGNAFHPRKKQGGPRDCWKVVFDNGQYVIGSEKHPFLMRDCTYKRVNELKVGDSVMPFYQKEYGYKKHGYKRYRRIYNFSNGWQSEHKIIAEQFHRKIEKNEVVHHIDFKGSNNTPENLKIMNRKDHKNFHSEHNKNVIWGKENYENQLNKLKSHPNYINRKFHSWDGERAGENNPFYGNTHSEESNKKRSETLKEVFIDRNQNNENNPNFKTELTVNVIKFAAQEYYKEKNKLDIFGLCKFIGCDYSTLTSRLSSNKISWKNFKKEVQETLNHKIVAIEYVGKLEVYDVTVDEYHNFATDSCIVSNTMDMDPIISSALDIYADESLTQNELGDMLTINSTNDNIKQILHNLFYDILNIEFNLWSWTRNLVKYGDFYLKLYISPEYGVYMVEPISSYNVTRVENSDVTNKNYVKFQVNLPEGGKIEELENYQIAHFRLLSDSNFLPYGKGIIEGARRVWKQVSLMEDAMLIHRIMRAPEKRIYKVDIGNIPPNEVDQYMERLITKTQKVPYVDEKTGDYNLRFNLQNMVEDIWIPVRGSDSGTSIEPLSGMEFTGIDDIEYLRNKMMAALKIPKAFLGYEEDLCLDPNTSIHTLSGVDKTIKELIEDYNNGIKNHVYSIDENTKNIVPGEIEWAGYTRKNAELVRVWLDNGKYIDCTPDHNFMLRDGTWVEAQHLKENESLMPLYKKHQKMYKNTEYEKIYNPGSNTWTWTHKMVDSSINKDKILQPDPFIFNDMIVIHHKDFNRFNNNPSNLERISNEQHRKIHNENVYKTICSEKSIEYKKSAEFSKKKSIERKKYIEKNPESIEKLKKNLIQYNKSPEELSDLYKKAWSNSTEERKQHLIDNNIKHKKNIKMINSLRLKKGFTKSLPTFEELSNFVKTTRIDNKKIIAKNLGCGYKYIEKLIFTNGFDSIPSFYNETIGFKSGRSAKIRKSYFDLLLYHHHSVDNIQKTYNLSKKQTETLVKNHISLNHKVVKVEKLNYRIDACDLKISKYHNFATAAGVIVHNSGKATLAAEDVRFARTIQRVQKFIVSELTKIAIVHLYSQGYKDAELVDFSLELTNPSTIFEKEKVSVWQEKVNLAKDAIESNIFSKKWIYGNVFNMSEDDILVVSNDIVEDSKLQFRIKSISEEGTDPAKPFNKLDVSGGEGGDGGGSPGGEGSGMPEPSGEKSTPDLKSGGEKTPESSAKPQQNNPLSEKKRDQSGRKKARDYPYGEDPLGSGENNRRSNSTTKKSVISHKYANNTPLSFEKFDQMLKDKSLLIEKKENKKKSFLDESNIIE